MTVPDAPVTAAAPPFTAEAVRAAYDGAAARYAELFADSLRDYPVERGLLAAFAELVRANGGGPVAARPHQRPAVGGGARRAQPDVDPP